MRPTTVDDLLRVRADRPDWTVAAGSTDLMVGVNFGRRRPVGLIDVTAVEELRRVRRGPVELAVGSAVTFSTIEQTLVRDCPALAVAARTVGSPQIRAAATLGGNLATASPAGDAHPVLLAYRATVEVASLRRRRSIPIDEFFRGPGRNALAPDEVILAVRLPMPSRRTEQFAKVGVRNAMVISVASLAIGIDWTGRNIGIGLGSVGPTPLRASGAEAFLAELLWTPMPGRGRTPRWTDLGEFAARVAQAATPIDDLRGTARYRRHVVTVLAERCARRAIEEGREAWVS